MENASKALLMAGGILIALLIISSLVLMFSNLTNYQKANNVEIQNQEIVEFNNQYVTYARDNIRGNDIVSLVNKILDYNLRKGQDGYTPMGLEIKIEDSNFAYDTKNSATLIKNGTYNEKTIKNIFDNIKNLEKTYNSEKNMAALVTDISTIVADLNETDINRKNEKQEEAEKRIKEILHTDNLSTYGGLEKIQKDTKTYYEYIQFKRSYFNCTGTEYDPNSGRIIKMKFEFQRTGV